MSAYYNEHDPHAAQWLRNLIALGAIAPGEVDERSICDVAPKELAGFTQCHFFAGIGVWSYALRRAGVSDEQPIWTGSCPCQPLSCAGQRKGHVDERHLWPAFFSLIAERRPATIFGEQVASKDGREWLSAVRADLESIGYAVGAADLCAAGVGAPQIRQRLYFVASANGGDSGAEREQRRGEQRLVAQNRGPVCVAGSEGERLQRRPDDGDEGRGQRASGQGCEAGGVDNSAGARCSQARAGEQSESERWRGGFELGCGIIELGDTSGEGWRSRSGSNKDGEDWREASGPSDATNQIVRPGPTNGFWRDADWIGCTDGKWRPVEPGAFPLVDGSAFRMGSGGAYENKSRAKMLKGYGNAIVAPLAAEFIAAAMDAIDERPAPDTFERLGDVVGRVLENVAADMEAE